MDDTDKAILRAIQSRLPIAERPFLALGHDLGLGQDEVLARIARLKQKGIIRRIGGNFNSASLGFASTLCAARVPADKLDAFIAAVNAHPGVTHNYRRAHVYNVWFTFIAETMEEIETSLGELAQAIDVPDICSLPSLRMFKIKVDFPV